MMRFESTIAACRAYRAMPIALECDIAALRDMLVTVTGARRFTVSGPDKRVTVKATGELLGYILRGNDHDQV